MIDAAHRSAWLAWLATEKRYGDNTLDAYARDLDDFSAFAATTPAAPRIIDRQIFRGWLAHMAARQLARTTIARRVSSLRSFYQFCGRQQLATTLCCDHNTHTSPVVCHYKTESLPPVLLFLCNRQ